MVQPGGLTVELPLGLTAQRPRGRGPEGIPDGLYSAHPRDYGDDARHGILLDCIISLFHPIRVSLDSPPPLVSRCWPSFAPGPTSESTIQEGAQISNNLSIYLQEHEADLEIKENDPINLRQACRISMLTSGLML